MKVFPFLPFFKGKLGKIKDNGKFMLMIEIQVSLLFEISQSTTLLFEKPLLVPVFANHEKSKEDFRFYKKRQKEEKKKPSVFVFQRALVEAVHTPNTEELPPACQHQATRRVSCVCELLCFLSIYCVHLLARCVLRYQESPREVIYFWGLGTLQNFSI